MTRALRSTRFTPVICLLLMCISAGCGSISVSFTIHLTYGPVTPDTDGYLLSLYIVGEDNEEDGGGLLEGYRLTVTDASGRAIHYSTGTLDQFVGNDQAVVLPVLFMTFTEYAAAGSPGSVLVKTELWGTTLDGGSFNASYKAAVAII
ncbi:hypothetical protein JW905_00645 [bacterium]|nr:hypothetical protein [candidate division CSSED10-310 bacterium]